MVLRKRLSRQWKGWPARCSGVDWQTWGPSLARHWAWRHLIYTNRPTVRTHWCLQPTLLLCLARLHVTHSFTALISDILGPGTPNHEAPFVLGVFLTLAYLICYLWPLSLSCSHPWPFDGFMSHRRPQRQGLAMWPGLALTLWFSSPPPPQCRHTQCKHGPLEGFCTLFTWVRAENPARLPPFQCLAKTHEPTPISSIYTLPIAL